MSSIAEEKALLGRTSIGFWVYLMTDCLLFASLFATYAVLQTGTAGGPSGADIFDLPLILVSTIVLLVSSLACGVALIGLKQKNVRQIAWGLGCTFVLGVVFLAIEMYEFSHLVHEGYGPDRSAFLSAFFTLVGTHGLHILTGLIWLSVLAWTLFRKGLTVKLTRQLTVFGMFWHFLDLVWIFIFTVVYLLGAMK